MKTKASTLLIVALILDLYVWLAFYSFSLFPWLDHTLLWWNIPHLITICISGIAVLRFCAYLIDVSVTENKDERKN